MSADQFSEILFRRQKELKLSLSELSRRSKISRQSLYRLLNGEVSQARLTTFSKLANALEIHPLDLLRAFFDDGSICHYDYTSKPSAVEFDDVGFIGDITYPDYSIVSPGEVFLKSWEIRNIGKVAWNNRQIVCVDKNIKVSFDNNTELEYGLKSLENDEITLPNIQPGENHKISVKLKAPEVACTTISMWKMVDHEGVLMFPETTGLYCIVKVVTL